MAKAISTRKKKPKTKNLWSQNCKYTKWKNFITKDLVQCIFPFAESKIDCLRTRSLCLRNVCIALVANVCQSNSSKPKWISAFQWRLFSSTSPVAPFRLQYSQNWFDLISWSTHKIIKLKSTQYIILLVQLISYENH